MSSLLMFSTGGAKAAPAPFAGQPVEVPAPPPDTVPLPPAPHPAPPGPEPVPPEIEEPPLAPGTGEPVENPEPPPQPVRACERSAVRGRSAMHLVADGGRNDSGLSSPLPEHLRCAQMLWQQPGQLQALLAADGVIRLASPGWKQQLGYDPAALVGTRIDKLVDPGDVDELVKILKRAGSFDTAQRSRWKLADGSGFRSISWQHAREGGELLFSGCPVTADSELAQAQRLRAVARLCSGVSQEFNNLLQSLRHSLELIRRHANEVDQVRQHAERALTVAAAGGRMTAQLLEFVDLQRASLRPVQLAGLLAMRGQLQRQLGAAVELEMIGFQQAGWVLSVPDRLRAALTNLAINGGEAMPGGGKLILRCERVNLERDAELPSGAYVHISCEDQGPGIGEGLREFVFEPFFTTKAVGSGPGLGLSQVYGFARHCGGAVRIDGRRQRGGAVVSLLLPAVAGRGDPLRSEPPFVDSVR